MITNATVLQQRPPAALATGGAAPTAIAVAAPYGPPGPTIGGTSSSNVTIGNSGLKSFVINEFGRAFTPGLRVRASANDLTGRWLEGIVQSYAADTRLLTLTADLANGTGSAATWNINVAGERGSVGPQGPEGPQGDPGGPPGPAGSPGASAGSQYKFSTVISGNPGNGHFSFNNANLTLATVLSISELDDLGTPLAAMLAAIDDGNSARKSVVRFATQTGAKGIVGFVSGAMTDQGAYDDYPWTPLALWGAPAADDVMFMSWSPIGDKGDTGATGAKGDTGAQGPQGIIADPPSDSQYYSRRNAAWAISPGGLTDAPNDGSFYGRLSAAWAKGVKLAGDTMTGLLTLSGPPTANLHAATKAYVDAGDTAATANLNAKVNKAGDTMTGQLTLPSDPTAGGHAARKDYIDAAVNALQNAVAGKVAKAGDTMTNDLTVYRSGAPTTGAIFFGNSGNRWLYFDGSNFSANGPGRLWGDSFAGNYFDQNGYQRLPSGLIVQWGMTPGSSQDVWVYFPTTFPSAVVALWATTWSERSDLGALYSAHVSHQNVTGFAVHPRVVAPGGGINWYAEGTFWMAIGW